MFAIPEPI